MYNGEKRQRLRNCHPQVSLEDIKLHLHGVYEMVGVGVQENIVAASNIRYISNQIGCHNSKIDDNECDLRELMGIVEIIKEEVMKMSRIPQCNHYQESSNQDALPMEEISVTYLFR